MISLQHVNLIQILGICMEPNVMMVSELAELGSLLDFLKLRKETLYGHNLLLYCQQICAVSSNIIVLAVCDKPSSIFKHTRTV